MFHVIVDFVVFWMGSSIVCHTILWFPFVWSILFCCTFPCVDGSKRPQLTLALPSSDIAHGLQTSNSLITETIISNYVKQKVNYFLVGCTKTSAKKKKKDFLFTSLWITCPLHLFLMIGVHYMSHCLHCLTTRVSSLFSS